jgi:SsrA-binding protein
VKKEAPKPTTAINRKASFDISIQQSYEAGIVLTGEEIKGIRAKRMHITGAYVKFLSGRGKNKSDPEAYLVGMHISQASEPERSRKLLLHAKEIGEIHKALSTKGNVAVPLKIYFKHGWAKVSVGVGVGRKSRDKRNLLKQRDAEMEGRRAIKGIRS